MTDRASRRVRSGRHPLSDPSPAHAPRTTPIARPGSDVADHDTHDAPSEPARLGRRHWSVRGDGHHPGRGGSLAERLERMGPSDLELAWWAVREPALAGLGSLDALRAEQLDPTVPAERKDARLAALLRLAAHHGEGPAEAVMALLVPGMRHRVALWAGSLDPEEAWAEMATAVWARIARYATAGPPTERVASKLLGAGTKKMVAARDRNRAWAERTVLCECVPGPTSDSDDDGDAAETLRRVLDDAVTAGVILKRDADLIAATRIGGLTVAAAARLIGIRCDTARKRRKTAEHKLARHQHEGPGWH